MVSRRKVSRMQEACGRAVVESLERRELFTVIITQTDSTPPNYWENDAHFDIAAGGAWCHCEAEFRLDYFRIDWGDGSDDMIIDVSCEDALEDNVSHPYSDSGPFDVTFTAHSETGYPLDGAGIEAAVGFDHYEYTAANTPGTTTQNRLLTPAGTGATFNRIKPVDKNNVGGFTSNFTFKVWNTTTPGTLITTWAITQGAQNADGGYPVTIVPPVGTPAGGTYNIEVYDAADPRTPPAKKMIYVRT